MTNLTGHPQDQPFCPIRRVQENPAPGEVKHIRTKDGQKSRRALQNQEHILVSTPSSPNTHIGEKTLKACTQSLNCVVASILFWLLCQDLRHRVGMENRLHCRFLSKENMAAAPRSCSGCQGSPVLCNPTLPCFLNTKILRYFVSIEFWRIKRDLLKHFKLSQIGHMSTLRPTGVPYPG